LSEDEAKARLTREGKNTLAEEKEVSWWKEALEELTEPMILLLLLIGVLYSVWGHLEDAVTIFAVILTLVIVEVYNELRAEKTILALNKLSEPTTTVRRGGKDREVKAEEIVRGDVIVLAAGRRVPADARLVESYGLAADEAPLTGESAPQEKSVAAPAPDVLLSERSDMVYAGTVVTRGRGTAVVVATGAGTELGKIVGLARREKPPRTVLQMATRDLTKWMVVLAVVFSAAVPLLGWLVNGQDPQQMFLTGLSLAFATIPEELPIIITMVLAIGGYRLSRQNAIVKRLQAVETLGAVTVICADKTGTITSNRMEVVEVYPRDRRDRVLRAAVLANDARPTGDGFTGDPVDVAMARAAVGAGIDVGAERTAHPLVTELTFDNVRKRMSVIYRSGTGLKVAAKGSPESILGISTMLRTGGPAAPLTDADMKMLMERTTEMAGRGMRVLAIAEKEGIDPDDQGDEVESGLTLLGLIGLADPPRPEAAQAIAACQNAGVRVIMITGDHPLTASTVAKQVGLNGGAKVLTGPDIDAMDDNALRTAVGEVSIFARSTPEHKLRILKALRANGARIAMTGDGINDAPALSSADIGIAMGQGGTDVARESADMVLTDNNFSTIVGAIKEGRVLFANLTKGVRYYLACKVALIVVSLVAVLLRLDIPFTPVQIILMELFMDLGASAAFVAERSEGDLMERPPRDPQKKFMDRKIVTSIFAASAGLIFAVAGAYLLTWYGSHDLVRSQTVALVTWLVGHVLLALNMRTEREPLLRVGPFTNRTMIVWGLAAGVFAVAVTTVTPLFEAVKTTSIPLTDWALVIVMAIIGTFWMEALKLLRSGKDK
jgi:Ca2+-transporting ATPase